MANNNYNKSKPKYTWGTSWTSKGATQKQAQYIVSLAEQANIQMANLEQLTRGAASGLIEELKRVVEYGESLRYLKRDWSEHIAGE
jgi:hypothetical protein